jgi:hypothetical protein
MRHLHTRIPPSRPPHSAVHQVSTMNIYSAITAIWLCFIFAPSPVNSVELDHLLQDSEIFLSAFLKQNSLNRVVFYFDDEPRAKCGKFFSLRFLKNIYSVARLL